MKLFRKTGHKWFFAFREVHRPLATRFIHRLNIKLVTF